MTREKQKFLSMPRAKHSVLILMTLLCWVTVSCNSRGAEYSGNINDKILSSIMWTGFIITIICFIIIWIFLHKKKRLSKPHNKRSILNNYSITASVTISIIISFIISVILVAIAYSLAAWGEVLFAFFYVAPVWLPGVLLILWTEYREKKRRF